MYFNIHSGSYAPAESQGQGAALFGAPAPRCNATSLRSRRFFHKLLEPHQESRGGRVSRPMAREGVRQFAARPRLALLLYCAAYR